jgi:hypothetical protein
VVRQIPCRQNGENHHSQQNQYHSGTDAKCNNLHATTAAGSFSFVSHFFFRRNTPNLLQIYEFFPNQRQKNTKISLFCFFCPFLAIFFECTPNIFRLHSIFYWSALEKNALFSQNLLKSGRKYHQYHH